MFVLAQVSSMKTSLEGSRSSWLSDQASRRFTMSGRSCSFASADFFPGDAVACEEAPQRADAEAMPALGELRLKLFSVMSQVSSTSVRIRPLCASVRADQRSAPRF
jgi:hypothetical protein